MTNTEPAGARAGVTLLAALLALTLLAAACADGPDRQAPQTNAAGADAPGAAPSAAGAAAADPAELAAEIARLEKEAQKNPADGETREALSRAYVRRANALRDARRMREALSDYQRALRNDPDNEEAQRNAAALSPLVEGTPTGEYGEPAPLPISPDVTAGDEQPSPPPASPPPANRNPGR